MSLLLWLARCHQLIMNCQYYLRQRFIQFQESHSFFTQSPAWIWWQTLVAFADQFMWLHVPSCSCDFWMFLCSRTCTLTHKNWHTKLLVSARRPTYISPPPLLGSSYSCGMLLKMVNSVILWFDHSKWPSISQPSLVHLELHSPGSDLGYCCWLSDLRPGC